MRLPRPRSPPGQPRSIKASGRKKPAGPTLQVVSDGPTQPLPLIAEPDNRVLDSLRQEVGMWKAKATRLETELKYSRLHAKFVQESVLDLKEQALERARERGHTEALEEIETLWRSQHFCTELLYGINKNALISNFQFFVGADLTEKQYTHISRLLSSTYPNSPSDPKKKIRWLKRKVLARHGSKFVKLMPGPLSFRTLQKFATCQIKKFNLSELTELDGACVDIDRVLVDLISQLPGPPPAHVDIQILGDGFRAMRKKKFINIGFRILQDSPLNNSFSSLATL